jgi:polyphosphate glucokinase
MTELPSDRPSRRLAIGIDVGGSGIKAALVDVESGGLASERVRVRTPQPATPGRVIESMRELVDTLSASQPVNAALAVGVGVPGVTDHGIVRTAANIDDAWVGFDAGGAIAAALQRRTAVVNDADAAGVAEMQFGAGRGRQGTVLIVTLGTGIGSALFRDGRLIPNTEFGHIEMRGKDAEQRASAAVRTRRRLTWDKWAAEVNEFLNRMDRLLWPDLVIVGGGVSKEGDKFIPRLAVRPPVVAAQLRNEAGIVGAAMLAAAMGPDQGAPPAEAAEATEIPPAPPAR